MQHFWQKMPFKCPTCQSDCIINDIHASVSTDNELNARDDANSDFRVIAFCVGCNTVATFYFDSLKVRQACYASDEEEESKKPKLLSPTEFTEEDLSYLHALHISEGD